MDGPDRRVSTLEEYQHHLERYGSELLLQAAAAELSENELGQLKAMVGSMERVYRWHKGQWVERRQGPVRECNICGLDLPRNARSDARHHKHCASKAYRRAKAAKSLASSVGATTRADLTRSGAV
jgi:hypothetical protein